MNDRADRPRRILQLVTHDGLGGIRTLVEMLETDLRAEGFAVDTMALTTERGGLTPIADMSRVAGAILSGRYDAIFTYQAAASLFGNLLGTLRGVPLRAPHQTAAPEGIRPHWRALDRMFGTIGIYTHIVSNSGATSDSFAAWPKPYRDRFVLIPHGVDAIAPSGVTDWRATLRLPLDAPVLLATGRMTDQKNHATAAAALPLLPNAHLLIAGDGPLRDAIRAQATSLGVADRLHLLGPIDRARLGDLLATANVYLFPSVWETFGLAGVEAAMAGLPIVAADLPVLREVLDLGPAGMVRFHPTQDAEQLAAAVRATLAAYPDPASRSAFAAAHVARHSRARMIALYRDLLLNPKAR